MSANLGLLGGISGRLVPTVAGVMLFGRHPQLIHPEWGLAAVRVKGAGLSGEVSARSDLEGNLPVMVDRALQFIRDHTSDMSNLIHDSDPDPEYPEDAVREAVINALIHRDYRLSGRIMVRVFDDRLEVWSPGGMPVQVALEHMAQRGGVSFPRNPLIASVARSLGLMDQIGRGLPLIRKVMAEVSTAPASFASSQVDFLVVLRSRLSAQTPEEKGN